jgi:hypothetical protein
LEGRIEIASEMQEKTLDDVETKGKKYTLL